MEIEEVKKELLNEGKNPFDFNINYTETGYSITPKWFYETKQIARKEDEPIKDDVDFLADTASLALMDSDDLATVVSMLMQEVDELKQELEALKK